MREKKKRKVKSQVNPQNPGVNGPTVAPFQPTTDDQWLNAKAQKYEPQIGF